MEQNWKCVDFMKETQLQLIPGTLIFSVNGLPRGSVLLVLLSFLSVLTILPEAIVSFEPQFPKASSEVRLSVSTKRVHQCLSAEKNVQSHPERKNGATLSSHHLSDIPRLREPVTIPMRVLGG